ncbi:type III-A CRISPR-associated RAMP protein Csm5 [Tabrizicola sp. YIM 78059]|uniref:type III-A CRISPR-associated RAMP protein Csm5 n=1 Tax=Tabrizicola sp. YIM 78059 TaxID=2529861 RepID=UPI0010A9A842|nr:type III-A CRISPR-associated RAMP protein Csm5 [Tabrizicola sp. YIM 78059]
MTGAQFITHRLVLVPLTPIHIGGGEEARLLPQDYRLRGGHAERIDLRAVLARLSERERAAWIADMARASGDALQNVLRSVQGKAGPSEVIERIPISAESAREVDLAGEGQGRRNQIDAFFRAGGRPCLPGSSLKGALRTAWAAEMARRNRTPQLPRLEEWRNKHKNERARIAADMVANLFAIAQRQLAQDTDPFRDVEVADAPLPEGATRIDPVATWKRGRPAPGGGPAPFGFATVGQMHRERMRSVADGGAPPVVGITLGLRDGTIAKEAAAKDAAKRPKPDRVPDGLSALLAALEAHHAPLWQREVNKTFFDGPAGDRLRQSLDLFSSLPRGGDAPQAALVRIGWAAHAEAKSLAGLRRIERPQARGADRFAAEGSTRHVVNLAGHPLPFGWALLVRAEAWDAQAPRAWLDPPAARPTPVAGGGTRGAAPAGPRAQTALGQQLRFRKGQKVMIDGEEATLLEDVTAAMKPGDSVRVSLDGDIETVKVSSIQGPA